MGQYHKVHLFHTTVQHLLWEEYLQESVPGGNVAAEP